MSNSKHIICFVGRISSGKGSAAAYLCEKHDAQMFTFSDILRDVLRPLRLEETRDNFIKMSETLRATFGEDLLARIMAVNVEQSGAGIVAVDGTRRLADSIHLSKLPGFVLVSIDAEPEVRYERLSKRTVKADDQTKTYTEFLADEQRSTETSINEIIGEATKHIDNNGDFATLYRQLDDLVREL